MTELQEAVFGASVERVTVFANTQNISEVTEGGLGLVHLACQASGQETRHLSILLAQGAESCSLSYQGFSPLHLTAWNGDVERARVLVEALSPHQLDITGFGGVTALHLAVLKGHLPLVTLLATTGASLGNGDLVMFTPLHYAAWYGRDQIAQVGQ